MTAHNTELDILTRVLEPTRDEMSADTARRILAMTFTKTDRLRMDELGRKAAAGDLTDDERVEAETFAKVGHLLSGLHSRARVALSGNGSSPSQN